MLLLVKSPSVAPQLERIWAHTELSSQRASLWPERAIEGFRAAFCVQQLCSRCAANKSQSAACSNCVRKNGWLCTCKTSRSWNKSCIKKIEYIPPPIAWCILQELGSLSIFFFSQSLETTLLPWLSVLGQSLRVQEYLKIFVWAQNIFIRK